MRGDGAAAGACLPSGHPRVLLVARREVVGLARTGMPSCPGAANETSPPRPSFPEGSILPPPPGGFSRSKEPASVREGSGRRGQARLAELRVGNGLRARCAAYTLTKTVALEELGQ